MDIIERLNWRYATKEFDNTKKLNKEQLDKVLDALRLSASSFGLQPWKFVVVENEQTRATLREASWNQAQIVDASHLIVLCRPSTIGDADVDRFLTLTSETNGAPLEALKGFGDMMKGFLANMDDAKKAAWMKNQIYLALGNLLTVCAALDIDTCPIEGFSPEKYDQILDLPAKGLNSVVVCPIGYRKDSDKYASAKKVRYTVEDVTLTI